MKISFGYLIFGILFQLLFYGDGPFDSLWTWLHILAWPWFILFYFFWYALIIGVVVGAIAFVITRFS